MAAQLWQLAGVDPYTEVQKGPMQRQAFEIQQMAQQQQYDELMKEQQQAKAQPQAGQPGLGQMAQQAVPKDWKLTDENGLPTVAGQINSRLVEVGALTKDAQMYQRDMKNPLLKPDERTKAGEAYRRTLNSIEQAKVSAAKLANDTKNNSIYALATATTKDEWDNVIKGWENNGFPIPANFPTDFSPENLKKVQAMAPAELQSKINSELRARDKAVRDEKSANLRDEKIIAALRGGEDSKEFKDVRGQRVGLKSYLPESEINKLGAKEIPAVSAKLEAANLTDEIANLTSQNKKATGLAATFFNKFEKYMPSRYKTGDQNQEGSADFFKSDIDKIPVDTSKYTQDEISQARLIAKKAVDLINARALAANPQNRLLVSELRMQKDVLGLENLTPESAPYVYRGLAKADRESLRKFGIDPSKIIGAKSEETSAKKESAPQSITVGDKTYKRSSYPNMSDADWSEYVASVKK